jgi:hypothetical protein
MEKAGMEDIVNLPLSGELHAVGHGADDFCDFEGAKVFSPEFGSGVRRF